MTATYKSDFDVTDAAPLAQLAINYNVQIDLSDNGAPVQVIATCSDLDSLQSFITAVFADDEDGEEHSDMLISQIETLEAAAVS
jgi:hypothetical protein